MEGEVDLLLSLPDDVLVLISSHLSPRDLSSLSLCSRPLHSAVSSSDKIWLSQCLRRSPLPLWRSGVSCYRSLCRFLLSVSPLLGLWVHHNPELGNLVHLSLGPFLSLRASRVVPRGLPPRPGPLRSDPVFEILSSFHGVPHLFFLHGRTPADHRLYPGSVRPIGPNPNVLLLEVYSHPESPPFSRLAFADRRRLLDAVSERVGVPYSPLYISDESSSAAAERRASLFRIHSRAAGGRIDWRSAGLNDKPSPSAGPGSNRRSFFSVVRQIVGKPAGASSISSKKNRSSAPTTVTAAAASNGGGDSSGSKHVSLGKFLKGGDTVGLTLRAVNVPLNTYLDWPNMHGNQFALHKLPLQEGEA